MVQNIVYLLILTTKNMKHLTRDQFAKFIASIILDIDNYSFDVLYDIKQVMDLQERNRSESEVKRESILHLMIRNTGCDLVKPNDTNYREYKLRSTKIYALKFCWNCDYFSKESFCDVIELININK